MTNTNPAPLLATVTAQRDSGLSVLPVRADGSKAAAVRWQDFITRRATDQELAAWFGSSAAQVGVAIAGGLVSGGLNPTLGLALEIIDHDAPALLDEWRELVEEAAPGLLATLPQVATPKGGLHVYYRCVAYGGNQKLAEAESPVAPGTPGAHLRNGQWWKTETLIETRGQGGYVIAPGSPLSTHASGKPYTLINGDLLHIPTITPHERDVLLTCARALNQLSKPNVTAAARPAPPTNSPTLSPGDDFNARGDVPGLLKKHGWTYLGTSSAGERWMRPGGQHNSATLFPSGWLYVFSSNAAPFNADHYSPFAVYTILEHGGDYSAAATALAAQGYGLKAPAGGFALGNGVATQAMPNGSSPRPTPGVATATTPTVWEQPAPLETFTIPSFPLHTLPFWLRDFCAELAHETQTPVEMAALFVLSTLAAIIAPQSRVRVRGNWTENLNLYTLVALPPANRKSAVHAAVVRPLVEAEAEALEEGKIAYEHALDQWETQTRRREALRRLIATMNDGDKRDAKIEDLKLVTDWLANNEKPQEPRYFTDDTTPEELATLMASQGGCMAVLSAEGGLFDQMAGRYNQGMANLDVFLKGHAGDTLRVNRRGRHEQIDRPRLTIALAVQPDVVRAAAAQPGFRKRGLLGRFLYALPPSRLGQREIAPKAMEEGTRRHYINRMKWLKTMASLPPEITLDEAADALLQQYEAEVERALGPQGALAEINDWGGKAIGQVVRLAGLLHLAETMLPTAAPNETIGPDSVARAIELGRCLQTHALAIFGEMDARKEKTADAEYLLSWLQKRARQTFTVREVRRSCHKRFKTVAELRTVLDYLEDEGWIKGLDGDRRSKTPANTFEVGPYVLTTGPVNPSPVTVQLGVNLNQDPVIDSKQNDIAKTVNPSTQFPAPPPPTLDESIEGGEGENQVDKVDTALNAAEVEASQLFSGNSDGLTARLTAAADRLTEPSPWTSAGTEPDDWVSF